MIELTVFPKYLQAASDFPKAQGLLQLGDFTDSLQPIVRLCTKPSVVTRRTPWETVLETVRESEQNIRRERPIVRLCTIPSDVLETMSEQNIRRERSAMGHTHAKPAPHFLLDLSADPEVIIISFLLSGIDLIQRFHNSKIGTRDMEDQCITNLAEQCIENNQPLRAILPLKDAMHDLQGGNKGELTPLHGVFLKVCLVSKNFKAALPILEEDLTSINLEVHPQLNVEHLLLYYYYGALLYLGLKRYQSALDFFSICVCTPSDAVSAIMLQAYKKKLLCDLLVNGNVTSLPKYRSNVVRSLGQLCQPYKNLCELFAKGSVVELQENAAKHATCFAEDGNTGLVSQCLRKIKRLKIQRLTSIFVTLSLESIVSEVGLSGKEEAERLIVEMIDARQIFATINASNEMVSFRDNPEQFDGLDTALKLEESFAAASRIFHILRNEDEILRTTAKFVKADTRLAHHLEPAI